MLLRPGSWPLFSIGRSDLRGLFIKSARLARLWLCTLCLLRPSGGLAKTCHLSDISNLFCVLFYHIFHHNLQSMFEINVELRVCLWSSKQGHIIACLVEPGRDLHGVVSLTRFGKFIPEFLTVFVPWPHCPGSAYLIKDGTCHGRVLSRWKR